MPAYGIAQAGGVLTSVLPGDKFYLFNAEIVVANEASVAFSRAPGYGIEIPALIVFTVSWTVAPTATVSIQGSNVDVDSQYQDLQIIDTGSLLTGSYADLGGFAFYRAKVVTYSAGGALTVIAQR